jgi:ABC-2 type transport system ATP-binding protein
LSDRPNMIVADHLTKRYGRFLAVDDANFAISRGRVVGFLGPNGAGKTTTIRMIAGFLTPTSGSIRVDDLDAVKKSRAVRQRIGYLPEAAPVYGEMRVREFLKFRARMFSIPFGKRRRSIDLALRRCGLEEVQRRPIHQLSKGYRQRVGLAGALLHQPPVLILDEPTVGLDPAQIREFRGLIRELAQVHTILLSTHILPEVELTCDEIIMIARGKIRAQGSIDELRRKAANSTRYVVESDSTRAAAALRDIRGVIEVQSASVNGTWKRLTITGADGGGDLREAIAAELGKVGGRTRELTREAPSLEHLFVQMSAEAEAAK